jgi:molecular chaperone Hsp33
LVNTDDSIKTAGGFMIQIMPGADEETISKIEEQLKTTPRISTLLDEGLTPEEILEGLLDTNELNILEKMSVQFKCDCSKEKFGEAIIALGAKEIQAMIDEDHGAEAVCSFCNSKYEYSEEDLYKLKAEVLGGS